MWSRGLQPRPGRPGFSPEPRPHLESQGLGTTRKTAPGSPVNLPPALPPPPLPPPPPRPACAPLRRPSLPRRRRRSATSRLGPRPRRSEATWRRSVAGARGLIVPAANSWSQVSPPHGAPVPPPASRWDAMPEPEGPRFSPSGGLPFFPGCPGDFIFCEVRYFYENTCGCVLFGAGVPRSSRGHFRGVFE